MNPRPAFAWTLVLRLRLTAALGLLALLGVLLLASVRTQAALEGERLRMAHEIVDQALAAAARHEQLERSGQLSRPQAQAQALADITRLARGEPLWVADAQLRLLAHPLAGAAGRPLGETVAAGDSRFVPAVQAALQQDDVRELDHGGGTPGQALRSAVRGFAPWGWALGSGVDLQDLADQGRRSLWMTLGAALLLGGAALLGMEMLARDLQRRLARSAAVLQDVAQGRLSATRETLAADELGRLQGQVAEMQMQLLNLVQQIRAATDGITAASGEIACGNADLSQRTDQTASNLQAAATAMGQLTSTVAQTAESARQAAGMAEAAVGVARQGGTAVAQVVATMEQINTRSRRIAEITGVIDGIAFQTGILALNAAVEAARAGEQGRGFAVVATEVRGLADHSARAAQQIRKLIEASVERVGAGSRQVAEAGRTMDEIVAAVQRVAQIVAQIRGTTAEQSTGIAQINTAVGELDQVTRHNVQLVHASGAAADSLRQQAAQLARTVGAFRTAD